jgi:ClpX C4-type zinc finger protein
MTDKKVCIWCGRNHNEVKKMVQGPVVFICNGCVENMSGSLMGEDMDISEQVREDIDNAVSEGFKRIVKQLSNGPLQEKVQRMMHVKFQEDSVSPTFQEVFLEFKKGVEAEIAGDDFQTRYDLAIAYHEMGLSDDAFREMLRSFKGALRQKEYESAAEIMSAFMHIHKDAKRALGSVYKLMTDDEMKQVLQEIV